MSNLIPAMRPLLPSFEQLQPYLKRIDLNRTYSNFGPLYQELAKRFSEYLGVNKDNVALFANGTLALQAAIETVGAQGETWVMPSWTFVATAQAAHAARRRIHFADVEESTWALEPRFRPFAAGQVVVAPFGGRPPVEKWVDTGGWKIFDAASCFDSCRGIGALLDDRSALMISLHATKTLPAGEGALLVASSDWIHRAKCWGNFGFDGSRSASGPGLNAKISEYHAAVGLASLDFWANTRPLLAERIDCALAICESLGLEIQPSFRDGWVTSTWNVRFRGIELSDLEQSLGKVGIQTRQWWPVGAHEMPEFRSCTREELPVTTSLASQVLGLPFAVDLSTDEFSRIFKALETALRI